MKRTSRLLIVDDEIKMCQSLKTLLKGAGLTAFYTTSSTEALKIAERLAFDLFLLDIYMPGTDGFELLDHLISKQPHAPVIMMTGDASVETAVRALRKGAYDYLKKPFDPEELLKTVHNALNQKVLVEKNQLLHRRLRLSERRFRLMVHHSPDMIYTLDPKGCFVFVNNSAEKIFGFRASELIGKHFQELLPEGHGANARWRFNERRTGNRATFGFSLDLKTGLERKGGAGRKVARVELSATGMYRERNGEKSYIGTYGVIRDVTASKTLVQRVSPHVDRNRIRQWAHRATRDLNHLLMASRVVTSVLTGKFKNGDPYREQLRSLDTCVQHSASIASQLLALSKGDTVHIRPIEVKPFCRRVTFQLFNTQATEVFLAGDFNKWDPEANPMEKRGKGLWETTLTLPPGKYEFKFLVDGKWREAKPHEQATINRYGTLNNFAVVPGALSIGAAAEFPERQPLADPSPAMQKGRPLGISSVEALADGGSAGVEVSSLAGNDSASYVRRPDGSNDRVIAELGSLLTEF